MGIKDALKKIKPQEQSWWSEEIEEKNEKKEKDEKDEKEQEDNNNCCNK